MSDQDWHRVADLDELEPGGVRMAKAGPRLIALIRTEQGYSALDNACPHMGGPLGQGMIEDGRLVCPWHGRAYDPRTGECDGFAEGATVFEIERRDDGIYVAVPTENA
ncbi:MAG: Rieske (2Fe-2S) protein [Methyloligellaceae bacterium]